MYVFFFPWWQKNPLRFSRNSEDIYLRCLVLRIIMRCTCATRQSQPTSTHLYLYIRLALAAHKKALINYSSIDSSLLLLIGAFAEHKGQGRQANVYFHLASRTTCMTSIGYMQLHHAGLERIRSEWPQIMNGVQTSGSVASNLLYFIVVYCSRHTRSISMI